VQIRGFDFSYDTNLLNELGRTNYERARKERGSKRRPQREKFLQTSLSWLNKTLDIDPENLAAHYNLGLVYAELGNLEKANYHRQQHDLFRPDDHAVETAVTRHRQANPAADHAAAAFVIYDLNRPQAYGVEIAKPTPNVKSALMNKGELSNP
jgi:tetratricopeptide (TPR) repeat protein